LKRIGCAILILGLTACAASRKLSQVGLREPASVQVEAQVSPLRAKVIAVTKLPASCPKNVQDFPELALEKIAFPSCPEGLEESVQLSQPFLKLEERSTMEEVIASQCRSLGFNEFGDSLESMLSSFDTTGPQGRHAKVYETLTSVEGDAKILAGLKGRIQELVNYHLPLDRWMKRNGDFILPDDDLTQLNHLIIEKSCRMTDQEVDQAYRTIRSLEELSDILKEGPQEERINRFLEGMHQIIDKKLKEFFYP
jgi:hypothetical protein